ncbi:MAG: glucose/galactose MFS transporter, partial [Tahibacter sp.]
YMAYFFLALPSSWILERTGMKRGMALGLAAMAVGCAVFGTYATARNYDACLAGLFTIGSGMSLLQTASNPYISILGPIESAAARISIMGICNKVAGILSPVLLGLFVMKDVDKFEAKVASAATPEIRAELLNGFAAQIYWPYMVMAAFLLLFAVWIAKSSLPEVRTSEANAQTSDPTSSQQQRSIFQFPHLWLGVLCLFLYVGVEVLAADAIGTYGKGFGLPGNETKYFTAFTLGAMLLGYVIGLFTIPKLISQETGLAISAVLGLVFSTAAFLSHGYVSVGFVAALGLANALMWPAIFPLAIRGLGRHTEKGSALLIMGIAGGALIPRLFAVLKETHDFQLVFLAIAVPCYLYILFYSLRGHAMGQRASVSALATAA